MLSVVITPAGGRAEFGALLAQLVPAAVDGLVREVLLAGPAQGPALQLCEATGVTIVEHLAAARGRARADWLLILPQDFQLPDGWMSLVVEQAGRGGGVIAERRRSWRQVRRRRARLSRRG